MSDNQIIEMSKVIGQIEDELLDVKAAKEQVEAVIGSNKALSDSLQALFESAENVARASESSALQVAADIANKLDALNIQASDMDRYAKEGIVNISEQSARARAELETDLYDLAKQLVNIIFDSTSQSLETIKNELAEYRVTTNEVTRKFTESASDAIAKQEGYLAEVNKLVDSIQERQRQLDLKIEELNRLDITRLINEISEIRRVESEKAEDAKKWKVIELVALGACVVLGIIILIKLFIM